jgi:solute carrier family 39 (zinc transporter), member 1/2/3
VHLTAFQWFSLFAILGITLACGYYPLFRRDEITKLGGLPKGEAFASGVFLALSILLMLPSSEHLFHLALPDNVFPVAHFGAALAFLTLLGLAQALNQTENGKSSPAISLIMTLMISIPSFLLGTALGVSTSVSAVVIAVAIMAHKGSAGFALALAMTRSSLTHGQVVFVYLLFACSTPTGILVGALVHQYLLGSTVVLVKAVILSLAAGVFLFMAVLHDLEEAPMIVLCTSVQGFGIMLSGFFLTALVRLALGIAHSGHVPSHW